MEYKLKNGKTVLIRKPVEDDAEAIINVITTADTESPFLARNPGEFQMTAEELRKVITNVLKSKDCTWFVAEYDERL